MRDNNACPDQGQSPPSAPRPHPPGMPGNLVARYGAEALADGYVAMPQVVLRHRRALGITAGEWDYLCELWRYWRSGADPYPSVAALATGLAVDASTVRRHRLSLEAKGLLRVYRHGPSNCYDLQPLIAAAVAQERQVQAAARPCPAAREDRAPMPHKGAVLHAKEDLEKEDLDLDLTPYPPAGSTEGPSASSGPAWEPDCAARVTHTPAQGVAPHRSLPVPRTAHEELAPGDDAARLAERIAAIGAALHDDAPRSSLTRARHIQQEFSVAPARFLQALDLAARTVEEHAPAIRLCTASGEPNGMPYFFATLRRHLEGRHERPRPRPDRPQRGAPAALRVPAPDPEPLTETNTIWRAVLEDLRQILTTGNFTMWFATTRVVAEEDDTLRVAVPTPFNKQWLERKLAARVIEALQRAGHASLRVEYVVEAAA